MAINLKLHPQTTLLMLVDALMSTGVNYRLELYVGEGGVGGVIWQLNDDQQSGQFLFADADLTKLLAQFMAFVQREDSEAVEPSAAVGASEPAVQASAVDPVLVTSVPDATGTVG